VLIGGESQELLFDTVPDFVELNPGEFTFVFIPTSHPSRASGGCGSKGVSH